MISITGAALLESFVLGIALAMDAMTVTLSNSLCEPDMSKALKFGMPVYFALFQMCMPMLGYVGGIMIADYINAYAGVVSLVILGIVGGKMIVDAVRELREPEACPSTHLTWRMVRMEAIATSIDALIVGVSLAADGKSLALYSCMIGVTTFACCIFALLLGRKLGDRFGTRAQIAGGIVLICIGLKAFLGL